ncbi:MAG: ImmA/IrrE family metallo-endopeptidase [Cyanobacteria bacterium J06638_20]
MPASIRRKFIRATAEKLLNDTDSLVAPINVYKIAEDLGISVIKKSANADLLGFLLRDKESSKVTIGINPKHGEARCRFTVAHELGHFLLHEGEVVHMDKAGSAQGFYLNPASDGSALDPKQEEANLFAEELLMPAKLIERDISKCKEMDLLEPAPEYLKGLARCYEVNLSVFMIRLFRLGYVQL